MGLGVSNVDPYFGQHFECQFQCLKGFRQIGMAKNRRILKQVDVDPQISLMDADPFRRA